MPLLVQRVAIILGLVVSLLARDTRADTRISLAQQDFSSAGSESIKFFGDATIEGGALRLTRKVQQVNGAAL